MQFKYPFLIKENKHTSIWCNIFSTEIERRVDCGDLYCKSCKALISSYDNYEMFLYLKDIGFSEQESDEIIKVRIKDRNLKYE